jgi:hypothetical protein
LGHRRCRARTSHGSIGRFYGAGREHFGLPLVRRRTGETFT